MRWTHTVLEVISAFWVIDLLYCTCITYRYYYISCRVLVSRKVFSAEMKNHFCSHFLKYRKIKRTRNQRFCRLLNWLVLLNFFLKLLLTFHIATKQVNAFKSSNWCACSVTDAHKFIVQLAQIHIKRFFNCHLYVSWIFL